MYVIIIGSGPAGISAALYARRSGADVTVITKGAGALAAAEWVENYYGFAEPVSGVELERRSIEGAKRLGVRFETDEVMAILPVAGGRSFRIEGVHGNYEGDALILAAGAPRKTPAIPGIREFEGRGVSYCAICDAFFYRGKNVAVIGAGDYALHEADSSPARRSSVYPDQRNGAEYHGPGRYCDGFPQDRADRGRISCGAHYLYGWQIHEHEWCLSGNLSGRNLGACTKAWCIAGGRQNRRGYADGDQYPGRLRGRGLHRRPFADCQSGL